MAFHEVREECLCQYVLQRMLRFLPDRVDGAAVASFAVRWLSGAAVYSGEPEGDPRRVLRAPHAGIASTLAGIGDLLKDGQVIAEIRSEAGDRRTNIVSPFSGVLRGLVRNGMQVTRGLKIGDVDARSDREACFLVSDKSLAIGGGALEAILTRSEIRDKVYAK